MTKKSKKKENGSKAKKNNLPRTDRLKGKNGSLSAEQRRFKAIEIFCWIEKKAGRTHPEIAKKAGVSEATVFRYVEKIDIAMADHLDAEGYREVAFFGNILQALDNLSWFLSKRSERSTLEFLRGTGVFKEYTHADSPADNSTEEELEKRVREKAEALGIGFGNGSAPVNRISPVTSGNDAPPEHPE